jgi:hypothetical protein
MGYNIKNNKLTSIACIQALARLMISLRFQPYGDHSCPTGTQILLFRLVTNVYKLISSSFIQEK